MIIFQSFFVGVVYLFLQMDFRKSQFNFKKRSFRQILTPLSLFEKVIPVIQETSTSCHMIHAIVFHFTDGEGLRL